jgi:hypothetical protein
MNIYFFSCRTILTVFCTIYLLIFADIYPAQAIDNNIVKLIRVEGWEEVNKFRLDGLKSLSTILPAPFENIFIYFYKICFQLWLPYMTANLNPPESTNT